jgi:hypothetical protein
VDYESVVATTSASSLISPIIGATMTPLEAFLARIHSTIATLGAQVLMWQNIMDGQGNCLQGKEEEFLIFNFLKNLDERFIPLMQQVGLLSENDNTKKTLTAPLCLERFFHLCPENDPNSRDLVIRFQGVPNASCAINIAGDAQFASWECDDVSEKNGLWVRSLPGGWLIKRGGSDLHIRLNPWEEKKLLSFKLIVFIPGKNPQWCIQEHVCFSQDLVAIIRACVESNDEGLKEKCKEALVGSLAQGKIQDISSMESDLNGLMAELGNAGYPDFVMQQYDNPKWRDLVSALRKYRKNPTNGDFPQLVQALIDAEPSGRYLYTNSSSGCWYSSSSALGCALFLRQNSLPDAKIEALREAYLRLAIRYQKSPEWIHRVLTLYLAMHPYDVSEFQSGLSSGNVSNFMIDFFHQHCAPVLAQHPSEVLDESLVRLFLWQQQKELTDWRDKANGQASFAYCKREVFRQKAARPDFNEILNPIVQQLQPSNDDASAIQEAINAAKELFQNDKVWNGQSFIVNPVPSHVVWPYCLWKALHIDAPLDLLKPYFPELRPPTVQGGYSAFDRIKNSVLATWVGEGFLDHTGITRDVQDEAHEGRRVVLQIPLIATLRERTQLICENILNRFHQSSYSGLRIMYALGEFLKVAKINANGSEWQAIQRATGASDFDAFIKGDIWTSFIIQTIDNSIRQDRCLDGVYSALMMALPEIIKPKLPNVSSVYLLLELALQEYRELYLAIFNSHIGDSSEEGTYGFPRLQFRINPIFGIDPAPKPNFGFSYIWRNPKLDCLIPFKTGKFRSLGAGQYTSIFHSDGNKKNTSFAPNGLFKFTYIKPFSPVEIFYRMGQELFRKVIAPQEGEAIIPRNQKAFNDLMRLAFTHEEARREFLAFIAGFPHEPISNNQYDRWDPDNGGMPTSFNSICYAIIMGIILDLKVVDAVNNLNKHLKWWKINSMGDFFYPSFDLWKHLTVDLGYARKKDEQGHDTDLRNLPQPEPLKPDFTVAHDKPQPARSQKAFYKHYNVYGERIDIDLTAVYDSNNPLTPASVTSPKNPKNQGDRVQPSEPKVFQNFLSDQKIDDHADEIQKMFHDVCYLRQMTLEQIQLELSKMDNDLQAWSQAIADHNNIEVARLQKLYRNQVCLQALIKDFNLAKHRRREQEAAEQAQLQRALLRTQIQSLQTELDIMNRDLQAWEGILSSMQTGPLSRALDNTNIPENLSMVEAAFGQIDEISRRYASLDSGQHASLEVEGLQALVQNRRRELQNLWQQLQNLQQQQQAQNSQ